MRSLEDWSMVLARMALVLLAVAVVGAAVPVSALPVQAPTSCDWGVGIEFGGAGVCCDPNSFTALRPGYGCRNR